MTTDASPSTISARLERLGELSRRARARVRQVDMSPEAVGARLRQLSAARALAVYLMRMRPLGDESEDR